MDTLVKCCICGQLTDVALAILINNEWIIRELNEEYGHDTKLTGRDIGVTCSHCRDTIEHLEGDL